MLCFMFFPPFPMAGSIYVKLVKELKKVLRVRYNSCDALNTSTRNFDQI